MAEVTLDGPWRVRVQWPDAHETCERHTLACAVALAADVLRRGAIAVNVERKEEL